MPRACLVSLKDLKTVCQSLKRLDEKNLAWSDIVEDPTCVLKGLPKTFIEKPFCTHLGFFIKESSPLYTQLLTYLHPHLAIVAL
jgi:hypothetical protein